MTYAADAVGIAQEIISQPEADDQEPSFEHVTEVAVPL